MYLTNFNKLDFLENETSCEKSSLCIFDLFLHAESLPCRLYDTVISGTRWISDWKSERERWRNRIQRKTTEGTDRSYCSSSVKEEKENVSRTRYYGSTSVDPKWKLRGGGGRELDSLSTLWRQRVEKRKSRRGRRLLRITVSKTDRPHLPPLLVPTLAQEY